MKHPLTLLKTCIRHLSLALIPVFLVIGCAKDCEPFECNSDCTLGNIEIWNDDNCQCEIQSQSIPGCTNEMATNFNPSANCNDGSCNFPCTDAGNCNSECNQGNLESWDAELCECIIIENIIFGCTNILAINFDPDADCDDGSCEFPCEDPGICNTDCLAGDLEAWNTELCECETITETILGCMLEQSANYDPLANCNDGSCIYDRNNFIGSYVSDFSCPNDSFLMMTIFESKFDILQGPDPSNLNSVILNITSGNFGGFTFTGIVDGQVLTIPEITTEGIPLTMEENTPRYSATISGQYILNKEILTGQTELLLVLENGEILGSDTCDSEAIKL